MQYFILDLRQIVTLIYYVPVKRKRLNINNYRKWEILVTVYARARGRGG